jgi:predicted RNA-binding protein with PUA-like domain
MKRWLMKSEPDAFSIDTLAARPRRTAGWDGVRNYQARNYMRDEMRPGDQAFFYHSSCPEPGIYGVIAVSRAAYPDPTQFDRKSEYYDPKSTPAAPRWLMVDVTLVERWPAPVTLDALKNAPALRDMVTLRRGNRLSITPVTPAEWRAVVALAGRVAHR